MYAAWYDYRNGNSDIYFTKSNDGGRTFSKSIKVNFGEDEKEKTGQNSPSIVTDGKGGVYLTWEDKRNPKTGSDVYFTRLTDAGDSFEKNIHIDDEDAENSSQNYPSIAVNEKGIIVIAWDDGRSGFSDIYLSYSNDGGKSFSKNLGLGISNGKHRTAPSVAVDDEGNIYLIYQEWEKDKKEMIFILLKAGLNFLWYQMDSDDGDPGFAIFIDLSPSLAKILDMPILKCYFLLLFLSSSVVQAIMLLTPLIH